MFKIILVFVWGQGLNAFRCDETLCDVTLVAGDSSKTFPVHRAIMASASDYFKAMFTGTGNTELELRMLAGETQIVTTS